MNREDQQKSFLREAIQLAITKMKEGHGGPFGALVVKDGKIVGRGWNCVTSSNDPTAHAEVVAIRDACKNLKNFQLDGCEIYTSCEPCPMCLGAIYWARPKAIYFASSREAAAEAGFDDAFIYDELQKSLKDRSMPIHQLIPLEGDEAFAQWINKGDRIAY